MEDLVSKIESKKVKLNLGHPEWLQADNVMNEQTEPYPALRRALRHNPAIYLNFVDFERIQEAYEVYKPQTVVAASFHTQMMMLFNTPGTFQIQVTLYPLSEESLHIICTFHQPLPILLPITLTLTLTQTSIVALCGTLAISVLNTTEY